MENFGQANYGTTKFGGKLVIFDSHTREGTRYEFSYSAKKELKDNTVNFYYQCTSCSNLKKRNPHAYAGHNIPKITVSSKNKANSFSFSLDDIILTNPDSTPNAQHFCSGTALSKSLAVQIDREAREETKRGVKRPHQAFEDAEGSIQRRLSE